MRYFLIFISLLINSFITAQNNCDWSSLNDADKNYRLGNFEEAIKIINNCIDNGFTERQKVQAYRLLAKTYLATDNDSTANNAVNNLLLLDPKFQPDYLADPPKFIEIIDMIRRIKSTSTVVSVSKKEENIYETPATAILITNQQLQDRGYLDLEALLHDLPGFDISRSNGNLYSHIYQRGYRSINTNRTLFLIDGVEENDLWSSNVYLSRQYALSNIKNIEIVYGPASTMYGSNAFLGVINIITKEPEDFIKAGKQFGMNTRTGYGSYNTKFFDGTLAFRSKNNDVSASVTGRIFFSDEQDLSSYPEHDFASYTFENDASHYRSVLDITDSEEVVDFLSNHPGESSLYTVNNDSTEIILTDEGVRKAIDADNTIYDNVRFKDMTQAYSVNAKLKIYDFLIGWNTWSKAEGTGSQYTDLIYLTSEQGGTWRPRHGYLYAKYDKDLSSKFNISNFLRYKVHDFDHKNGVVVQPARYYLGNYNLNNLVNGDIPSYLNVYLFQKSNQLREELKILYQPSHRIDVVAGFEARFSSIQGDYYKALTDSAQEKGSAGTDIPGGNQFFSRDLGFYIQSGINVFRNAKVTLGLRYDNNLVRETQGYGNAFNPRLAFVLTPGNFIIKGIYAEAFKDATNREKYSTTEEKREFPNPFLQPEKVKNYEFVLGHSFFDKSLMLNVSSYYSKYSNIIQEVRVRKDDGTYTNQNQAVGRAEICGINAISDYRKDNLRIYANYTYTLPYAIDPKNSEGNLQTDSLGNPYHKLRISDIAAHQANFGVNYTFKQIFNFNIRANFVGEKQTGYDTTVPSNPETFAPYFLLNGTVSYSPKKTGLTLQVTGFNLLNKEYFSPGLDYATGDLASKLVQNRRNVYVSLICKF